MKVTLLALAAVLALTVSARGTELPEEVEQALPREARTLLEEVDAPDSQGLFQGVTALWEQMKEQLGETVRSRAAGAAAVVLAAVACGAAESLTLGAGVSGTGERLVGAAGAMAVTLTAAGSLETLMGLGTETIRTLGDFAHVLLPALAAATAAAGALTTATAQQVAAVVFVDLLLRLAQEVLVPLLYLYIGAVTAAAVLPESRLAPVAGGLKKILTWLMTVPLLAFTLYLSVARVIGGSADAVTVKVAKAALAGAVPVVGGILSEAAETVLAGAGMLKNTIGLAGTLAVLAACAYPFLQLGVQYLLFKLAAVLAGAAGPQPLCRLIDDLGGAFGLVLGMVGACGVLVLVAVLSCVGAVVP